MTHTPKPLAKKLSEIPLHKNILDMLRLRSRPSVSSLAHLIRVNHGVALKTIIPLPPPGFWHFLAKWLRTFAGETPPLRLSHSQQMGFSLSATTPIAVNKRIPRVWGHLCPIPQAAEHILTDDSSFASKTYITATDPLGNDPSPGPPHIILGPINLVNHACPKHNTAVPDASRRAAPRLCAPPPPPPPPPARRRYGGRWFYVQRRGLP